MKNSKTGNVNSKLNEHKSIKGTIASIGYLRIEKKYFFIKFILMFSFSLYNKIRETNKTRK